MRSAARYRLQYASHFQISGMISLKPQTYLKPVEGADLALLGNIGRPNKELSFFLKWCQTEFLRVYWVPGSLELSSPDSDKQDMFRQLDILRTWLMSEELSKVYLLTKTTREIYSPRFTILGSSLLNSACNTDTQKLYKWSNGALQTASPESLKKVQTDELKWFLRHIARSSHPSICLTANEVSLLPNKVFQRKSVSATLFGKANEVQPISFTGFERPNEPWKGVNMYGHSNYNPSAFIEFTEVSSEPINEPALY